MNDEKFISKFKEWQQDWNKFVFDVLKARLDKEQQAIITSVQNNPMTAVASGTARGKDFVSACASLCFLYLTPKFDKNGNLIENTKVAMTAPTGRQVTNIMIPEISRLFRNAKILPGNLYASGVRTEFKEWFLTGFKAGDDNTEAWSGFHATNTMFVVTEASGISEVTFNAIEGNLQGNSRLLIVFNPNTTSGYAANAMKSKRFSKFRLSSLNAPNVIQKKNIIAGQVDYTWVKDKVETWCVKVSDLEFDEAQGDFIFEDEKYRPNDLFRVKVLGMFPKASEYSLIPLEWIERAFENWRTYNQEKPMNFHDTKIGVDVAGMGRDSSVICIRKNHFVDNFITHQSAGKANHMHITGMVSNLLKDEKAVAFIDTIGEGAGVFSRLQELGFDNAVSCKFSEGAKDLTDQTGVYSFANMRAYLFWAVRDWLNPKNTPYACLPPDDDFLEEATAIRWKFSSNGSIQIEPKEEIKKRLRRSTDKFDALANTFYPHQNGQLQDLRGLFF